MSQLIFVTGATGFLGSHIVDQLLSGGYRVRAAARPSKVNEIRSVYAKHGQNFEAVAVSDVALDQLPEALDGVHAVIHTASPIAEKAETEEMLKTAVEGTLNVVRQAEKAGIQRIVVTSSISAVINPERSFTDKDWNPITRETALEKGGFIAYTASKTFAEQALWRFASTHPNLDVTTFNPPYFYGPFADGFSMPTPSYYAMSTNLYIYRLLKNTGPFPESATYVDVRDVAKAHVLALKAPLSSGSGIGKKRFILSSVYPFEYRQFLSLIKEKRPELSGRLTSSIVPDVENLLIPFDIERIEKVLGFKKEEYKTFEDTMLDAVDSILALEKEWVKKGYTIDVPEV